MAETNEKPLKRVLISAPNRSSGKSTVSIGLCAAWHRQGLQVQAFKKGPDYIDPMWLAAATGRDCSNLDFFMMGRKEILCTFGALSRGADLTLIEGNMGFFDGLDPGGDDSTAALSRLLKAPAILVVNARGMTRGVAPLILGHLQFEPKTPVAGVILNRVRGTRHEKKLKEALERYTHIEVVGAIPDQKEAMIRERHLGLTPVRESAGLPPVVDRLADLVSTYVDVDRIREISGTAASLPLVLQKPPSFPRPQVRIGVAWDPAFTFYYPENLRALRAAGAELVFFNTLTETTLPAVDGLYIGGGFPEIFMHELEQNRSLRHEIKERIDAGLPAYAECGGLMYLSRSISYAGKKCAMVGALPCDVEMEPRPMGHGYVVLRRAGDSPWALTGGDVRGHEFHHSRVVNLGQVAFAYKMVRGYGVDGKHDGMVYRNVLACYAHLHIVSVPSWAAHFVSLAQSWGAERG